MSNLSIFNFHNSTVRIQLINNEPLFCLSDVTEILNIKNANASRFNMSKAGVHKMYIRSSGQKRELTFINEPNLYRVIFRSNKKEAVDFQNWVFDEVLPAIRKTGSYSLTINEEQKYLIKKAVNERVYRTGEKHQTIYHKLYDKFKVASYENLPADKFEVAIDWLGGISQKETYLTDDELMALSWLYLAASRMRASCERVEPALRALNSEFKGEFWSMAHDYKHSLQQAKEVLKKKTSHIKLNRDWQVLLPIINQ